MNTFTVKSFSSILHKGYFLALCFFLFLTGTKEVMAQNTLTLDSTIHRVSKIGSNNRTGGYTDMLLPTNIGAYDHIEFYLKGGDGGRRKVPNMCKAKGGKGAVVKMRFSIGTGTNELKPGGRLRFIVGEKGDSNRGNGIEGGGGGGGTAILYIDPGVSLNSTCSRTINGNTGTGAPLNDLNSASSCWVLLGVAGGGGGAYLDGVCFSSNGLGGNAATWGDDGRGFGGAGGTNGSAADCGGGGIISRNNCGNRGGYLEGAEGQSASQNGGFGYGAGAGGNCCGGGGGGYSGGGDGDGGGGGGGGSFASAGATWSQKFNGSNTNNPSSGFITYQLQDRDPFAPDAICQDIVVQLDASGHVTIAASDADGGSTDPLGGALTFTFESQNGSPSVLNWDCSQTGIHVETLNVSNGNASNSCTTTITVEDDQAPTALCKNISVQLDQTGSYDLAPSEINNGSYDNCVGTAVSLSIDVSSFSCFNTILPTTVTLTVEDTLDNFSQCQAMVTVVDATAPTITCQNTTVSLGSGFGTTINHNTLATASDNCSILPLTGFSILNCSQLGQNNITITAQESLGSLTASCTSVVTIIDQLAPTALCKAVTVTLDASESYTLSPGEVDDGSFDNCGIVSYSLSQTNFDCSHTENTQYVTLSLADGSGNQSSCMATVRVRENEAPVYNCPSRITGFSDPTSCGTVIYYNLIYSDNCSVQLINNSPSGLEAGDVFPVGITQQKFTFVDPSGNSSSCSFNIVIIDNIAPIVSCPADTIVYNNQGRCGHYLSYNVVTADNCAAPTLNQTAGYPDLFPVGTTFNSFMATDASGNTASCNFSVTVIDSQAPGINCPASWTLANDLDDCGAVVNYTVTTGDNCSGEFQTQTAGIPSGSTFPIGTTTNSYMVTDAAGNTASCDFTVTVIDQQLPTINCPANITRNNDQDVCGAAVNYTLSTSDNCVGEILSQTTGLASGSTFPVGTTTNSYLVTDASGNTASCSFTVTISDSQAPGITCPSNITQANDLNACGAVINYGINTTDNCPGENYSRNAGLASGTLFPIGSTTNQFTVTDAAGNTSSCQFTVTITDEQVPTINCPADITLVNANDLCGETVNYSVTTTDNCPSEVKTQLAGIPSGGFFPVGTTTNQYMVTDAAGHTASCRFDVTINDVQDPRVFCNSITVSLDASGTYTLAPSELDNGSYDNCGIASFSLNRSTVDCSHAGSTRGIFLRVTDIHGNTNGCIASVYVQDNEAPSISCPASISLPNDPGSCGRMVTYFAPVGQDNCSGSTQQIAGLGSGSVFPFGTTTESYQVTDASGNTAACSFSITISDDEAPVINLLGDNPTILCEGDFYVEAGATVTDNCDPSVAQQITIDASGLNTSQSGNYSVLYTVTDVHGNSAQIARSVTVKQLPARLSPQNCGSCTQIRLDFCEGELPPNLEAYLLNNANYEVGATFLWYTDTNSEPGAPISTPVPDMSSNNTKFYWVSQLLNGCESDARKVRVRIRKTSTVTLDLPAIGCNTGQLDLAAWVSDSRRIATGYTFYDSDPDVGNPTSLGSVTASNGAVNSGQYAVVTLPASPVTYYAVATNTTGCQVTGSDEVQTGAGASLDSVANYTVNSGDLVHVSFSSPDASHIIWANHSSFNNPYIGLIGSIGMGDLLFTAQNNSSSPQTAMLRAIAYSGSCGGQVRDFTITVNPGTNNRQAQNSLQLTASKINAHDVQLNWQIRYEFALSSIEIEKQKNDGEWVTIGRQDGTVGTDHDLSLQDGSHLDRGGMANVTKYRLKLIHADGRAIWSQEVEVNFDYFNSKRFTLYPNPSDGRFRLRAAGPLEGEWRYKLSDGMGRTILVGKLKGSETSFDISHLPAGYYYLVMSSPEGKRYVERIVKR